jgi:Tfp pilus assembly major pilin PilA
VLLGALDVINCIIAVSSEPVVQYLVERDVVNLVLPLSSHAYAYVRMQALSLWILGNTGTITFKDQVVRPKVIDAIVQVR